MTILIGILKTENKIKKTEKKYNCPRLFNSAALPVVLGLEILNSLDFAVLLGGFLVLCQPSAKMSRFRGVGLK